MADQIEALGDEDLLFKYVSGKRALACLPEIGDGSLRATQPAAMNDPFECAVLKVFAERDREVGNQQLADALTKVQPNSPVTSADVEEARKQHGSLYIGELLRKQLSKRFGVVSFSTDALHPLLWAHYGDECTGVAIGYKVGRLRSMPRSSGVQLEPVIYRERPEMLHGHEILSSSSNVIIALRLKSDHWKYEGECRLIVELNETVGTGKKDRHGYPVNLFPIPNKSVARVYYTERTPPDLVSEIRGRLASPNNRFGVQDAAKLVLLEDQYRYAPE